MKQDCKLYLITFYQGALITTRVINLYLCILTTVYCLLFEIGADVSVPFGCIQLVVHVSPLIAVPKDGTYIC